MVVALSYEGDLLRIADRVTNVHLQVIDGAVRHFLLCEDRDVIVAQTTATQAPTSGSTTGTTGGSTTGGSTTGGTTTTTLDHSRHAGADVDRAHHPAFHHRDTGAGHQPWRRRERGFGHADTHTDGDAQSPGRTSARYRHRLL